MHIVYEEYDVVEYRGQYWKILAISGYNTVYIRNLAGTQALDDVPIDQIKPTSNTVATATYSTAL